MALAIITALPSMGQKTFRQGDGDIDFDVRVGANVSDLVWTILTDDPGAYPVPDIDKFFESRKVGFNVNFDVDFQILNGLYLETGLSFANRGDKASGIKGSNTRYNGTISLSYLEVPLLFSFRFNVTDETELYFDLGGYGSYGIVGGGKINEVDKGTIFEGRDFFVNVAQRWDAGAIVGLGAILNENIYAGFRIEHGFMNILQKEYRPDFRLWNRTISFQIGYCF